MAKLDPRQPEFWSQEALRLLDELSPFVLRMLLAGAQEGEAKLPPELRVLIDWDVFNDRALDYLRGYNFELIRGITETTRKATVKAIDDWVQSGAKFDVLIEKLNPVYGKARAQRIAVTEVTRVFAEGNTQAWKATGMVSARKWYTAQDERVCPICGPMHNKQADIGQPFYTRDGQRIDNPPAHPNCRCYVVPVVSREIRFI